METEAPSPTNVSSRLDAERLRALVFSMNFGVLVEDEQRKVALANEAFCQMWKIPVPPAQLVGVDCAETALRVAPMLENAERFLQDITRRLAEGCAAVDDEILFRDGRVVERDYVPIAVDAVMRGHLWVFRDVTASRKQAQLERAAAVRDELRLAIDTIPGLVWSARADGFIDFFNQRWCDYTGLTLEASLGGGWESAISEKDLPLLRERFRAAIASGQPVEAEARVRRFDGAHRWFLFRAVPLRDGEQRPSKWYGQTIDIDDRKRSEDALQHAQLELSHVTRVTTLGELAASIAHEVNQPISAMVADATACLNRLRAERPDVEKVRASLLAIVKDGARAGDVIARIRALLSRSALEHQRCVLDEVIASALALVRPQLTRQGIVVGAELQCGALELLGDPIELQQVILNLLINAGEACRELPLERRTVVLRSACETLDGEQWAHVSVEDAGVGIGSEALDRVFTAFYTTKPGGLGMGLSIIRSILERHRGRVWAVANKGDGTTFHFMLPAAERALGSTE